MISGAGRSPPFDLVGPFGHEFIEGGADRFVRAGRCAGSRSHVPPGEGHPVSRRTTTVASPSSQKITGGRGIPL